MHHILTRRTLGTVTLAAAVSAGSVAGVSLAQGNGSPGVSTPAVTAPAGGLLAGVDGVLAQLAAAGTIDQMQAAAIHAEAYGGSIDPKQLVDDGVLTDVQMRVVADRIDALKRSFAG